MNQDILLSRISGDSSVMVMGAGISGIAATRLLLQRNINVHLFDDKNIENLKIDDRDFLNHKNLVTHFGNTKIGLHSTIQACILSPGVNPNHDLIQKVKAQGILVINEIDLALAFLPAIKIIGITGTNGKSTTTVMMESVLKAAGIKAIAAGNLGTPLCELVSSNFEYEYVVLELSSFQLETLHSLKLTGAIIINITPDHLDRYRTFNEYQEAKLAITRLLHSKSPLISNQQLAHHFAGKNLSNLQFFSDGEFGVGEFAFLSKAPIEGGHNRENALAAATLALALGIDRLAIVRGLNNFKPLPHRCEIIATKNGITFINDSKGTTVVAVIKALSMGKRPTHLLLGGIEKGEDFSMLRQSQFPHLAGYYVYGQAKPKILSQLAGPTTFEFADLTEAFNAALLRAQPGDVILLSPGCASYDQFDNYQHRGQTFTDLVMGR